MSTVNKMILMGNLGGDPDVFDGDKGLMATVSLATNEFWVDGNNNKQSHTEWHKLVFFGKEARKARASTKKGSKLYVEGVVRTNRWITSEGEDRSEKNVVVDVFHVVSDGKEREKREGNN